MSEIIPAISINIAIKKPATPFAAATLISFEF